MTWFSTFILKCFWRLLPRLLSLVVDKIGDVIRVIDEANKLTGEATKREYVLKNLLYGLDVPDWLCRSLLEFGVALNKLGIRAEHLEKMERLLVESESAGVEFNALLVDESRAIILGKFGALFPDLPEHIGRLLFELAMAKVSK